MASGSQDVPTAPLGGVAMPIPSLRGRPELIELHIGQAVVRRSGVLAAPILGEVWSSVR